MSDHKLKNESVVKQLYYGLSEQFKEYWFSLALFIVVAVLSQFVSLKFSLIYAFVFWSINCSHTSVNFSVKRTNEEIEKNRAEYEKYRTQIDETTKSLKEKQDSLMQKLRQM